MVYSIWYILRMRSSGSNHHWLTQLLMFLVVDSVLYVANIETEIEWVQSPQVVSITNWPLAHHNCHHHNSVTTHDNLKYIQRSISHFKTFLNQVTLFHYNVLLVNSANSAIRAVCPDLEYYFLVNGFSIIAIGAHCHIFKGNALVTSAKDGTSMIQPRQI